VVLVDAAVVAVDVRIVVVLVARKFLYTEGGRD
jgi:hypothetical protein